MCPASFSKIPGYLIAFLLVSFPLLGNDDSKSAEKKEEKKEEAPPRIGNFSLPISQQPAGLFAFGGNIIAQNEMQIYLFADAFVGEKKRFVSDVIPSILYGINDELSIFFNAPFTPLMRDDHHRSSGLEDFFVQLEWAFYDTKTPLYEDQATIVGNITFPTGSAHRNPNTGFGAPSLFLGTTFYRTWVDWLLFTGYGAILTSSNHGTKFGDQFFYQYGVGKNFWTPPGEIYAWMIELDGQYNKKNRDDGHLDPNSGGNTIYLTPSLWYSNKYFLFQAGVSFPINQNLFGKQHKFDYVLNINMAWSFY